MSETTRHMVKACDCAGVTASGPRFILGPGYEERGEWVYILTLVPFACDYCNTPWRDASAVVAE